MHRTCRVELITKKETGYIVTNLQEKTLHKLYKPNLTATPEIRAKRRFDELVAKGVNTTFEETLEKINARDKNDMNKPVGALMIAKDAIVVDSSNLTIEEVYEKVHEIITDKEIS